MKMLPHYRAVFGLSQAALAEKIGISQAALSRIESGDLRPSDELVRRMQEALRQMVIIPLPGIKNRKESTMNENFMQFDARTAFEDLRSGLIAAKTREEALAAIESADLMSRAKFATSSGAFGDTATADPNSPEEMLAHIEKHYSQYLRYAPVAAKGGE